MVDVSSEAQQGICNKLRRNTKDMVSYRMKQAGKRETPFDDDIGSGPGFYDPVVID